MMVKRIISILIVTTFLLGVSIAFASRIEQLESHKHDGRVEQKYPRAFQIEERLLCIEGLKVLQTTVFSFSDGTGAAVSTIQLYEERNGRVVPASCVSKHAPKK